MSALTIIYEITDDTPDGLPWPPVGDDHHWHVVRRDRGRTTWRRIELQVGAPEHELPPGAYRLEGVGRTAQFRRAVERARRRGQPP